MKKILYLLIRMCIVLLPFSCNDDNEGNPETLTGAWDYEKPYFEFEYAADSISLEMYQNKKMSVAVSDLKSLFLQMAQEKMGSYFRGIRFLPGEQLSIYAQMQSGTQLNFHAAYRQSEDIMEVNPDKEEMKQLIGEKAEMIPAVSFKYALRKDRLILYFDQAYIRTVYSMMQTQIISMVVQMMGIDFSKMPEGMESQVREGVKQQINRILDQIIRLEIGFELTPAELDV